MKRSSPRATPKRSGKYTDWVIHDEPWALAWFASIVVSLVGCGIYFTLTSGFHVDRGLTLWMKGYVGLIPPEGFSGDGPLGPIRPEVTQALVRDTAGRAMGVKVVTMNDNYRWLKGSDTHVGISGGDSVHVEAVIRSFGTKVQVPVLVLGMASHEGRDEHPAREDYRAQTRADVMADASSRHFERRPELWKANLGVFTQDAASSETSSTERRLVFLEVTCRDPGVDMTTAVRAALIEAASKSDISVQPDLYTNFALGRFRVTRANRGAPELTLPNCAEAGTLDGDR